VLLAGLLAVVAVACGDDEDALTPIERGTASTIDLGDGSSDPQVEPASLEYRSYVATGREGVTTIDVYDAPDGAVVNSFDNPRLINDDPNAPVPAVFLLTEAVDLDDPPDWVEVYLPVRPNGSKGWLRSEDVELSGHDYHLEVRLADFNLKAFRGDEVVLDAPIAVAADNTPTPGGLFYTIELIAPPDPDGPYGPFAYGLSGFSEVLESFNGGNGQLGIHGTNQPELMGQKVSHGCIRLRNEDITRLADELPLGVPVQVIA
jgi:hypothetical protein